MLIGGYLSKVEGGQHSTTRALVKVWAAAFAIRLEAIKWCMIETYIFNTADLIHLPLDMPMALSIFRHCLIHQPAVIDLGPQRRKKKSKSKCHITVADNPNYRRHAFLKVHGARCLQLRQG